MKLLSLLAVAVGVRSTTFPVFITGGTLVGSDSDFPFMADIEIDGAIPGAEPNYLHRCGGVYIAKDILLTAGKCADTMTLADHPDKVFVTVGRTNRTDISDGFHYTFKKDDNVVFPDTFEHFQLDQYGDLALIRMTPTGPSAPTYKVRLNRRAQWPLLGQRLTALGFADPVASDYLRRVNLRVLPQRTCLRQWERPGGGNTDLVCTEGLWGRRGKLDWLDWGGPLLIMTQQGPVVFGIEATDFGTRELTAFTRTATHAEWIDRTLARWNVTTAGLWYE